MPAPRTQAALIAHGRISLDCPPAYTLCLTARALLWGRLLVFWFRDMQVRRWRLLSYMGRCMQAAHMLLVRELGAYATHLGAQKHVPCAVIIS